jgi:hypothetical protein
MCGTALRWIVALAFALVCGGGKPASAAKKVAFVVGIDFYDNLGADKQLQRAVNDARAISAAFSSLGLEVVSGENLSRAAFNEQWQKFIDTITPGDTAAIYFSGHGVEIGGLNYILPRDIPNLTFGRQEQLQRESLSVAEFLLDLRRRQPQVTLVILDACRDHPFVPPQLRSTDAPRGLARMEATRGTFIMYSAGAGETALDRLPKDDPDHVNSVYTRRLLPLLKMPGLALPELAQQVRREVHDLAATVPHFQQPAYYDGLIGKYCLAGCEAPSSPQLSEVVRAWQSIEASTDIGDLEAFRNQYGKANPFYDRQAEKRIDKLRRQADAGSKAAEEAPAPARIEAEQKDARIAALQEAGAKGREAPRPPEPTTGEKASIGDEQPKAVALTPKIVETAPDPSTEGKVSRIRAIQVELKRVGCDPGSIDGTWGRQARAALSQFAKLAKLDLNPDEPSEAALGALATQRSRVCPPTPKVTSTKPREPAPKPEPSAKAAPPAASGGNATCSFTSRGYYCDNWRLNSDVTK